MRIVDHFGKHLRYLRVERELSVRKLAELSGVSSVWITLIENGHRSVGIDAIEKLAKGLKLREPEMSEFRMLGLTASVRSDLLGKSRKYGPVLNNAIAMHLDRLGIVPRDVVDAISQPQLGVVSMGRLATALEERALSYRSVHQPEGSLSAEGPFLETRFKDGSQAFFVMLATNVDDS